MLVFQLVFQAAVTATSFLLLCSANNNADSNHNKPPHIIFVMMDDVGHNDISYNSPNSPIPTPHIDALAYSGIQLKNYYAHSLCTASRASLLTGRYQVNTGLSNVLVPGTPGGLPDNIPTIPQTLKDLAGYVTAMTGKWHLGHAQRKQTPVGKGFDYFLGMYMWDTDPYSKQFYADPGEALFLDWIEEYALGRYEHFAEPRHATEAITIAAQEVMRKHANSKDEAPLFLYVAYTAAHSPLIPMPEHEKKCLSLMHSDTTGDTDAENMLFLGKDISVIKDGNKIGGMTHSWRQQFCGMVLGIDDALKNLTETIFETLGDNTVIAVASDNGGSPWFGGMNYPLRGAKNNPMEGGIRVPAFVTDLSRDRHILGGGNNSGAVLLSRTQDAFEPSMSTRTFNGMMHVSDWLPTFLSLAGVPASQFPSKLDGHDMSFALRDECDVVPLSEVSGRKRAAVTPSSTDIGPRKEMLIEMYDRWAFDEALSAYRWGDYKLVKGIVRSDFYYMEASETGLDAINIKNKSWFMFFAEKLIRLLEIYYGSAPLDTARIAFTHANVFGSELGPQLRGEDATLRLFNIKDDPLETRNLVGEPNTAEIIATIESKLAVIKAQLPPQQKVWLGYHLEDEWPNTFYYGDCSDNPNMSKDDLCVFTHPWIEDDVDPWTQTELIEASVYAKARMKALIRRGLAKFLGTVAVLLTVVIYYIL